MAASGRLSFVPFGAGDIDVATADDSNFNYRVNAYFSELDISGGFVVNFTTEVHKKAACYSSLVRYWGRRLIAAAGLADWLLGRGSPQSAATMVGASAVHTYTNWASSMQGIRGSTTLQQLWALQLHALFRLGDIRVDIIFSAGFQTPASLAIAYEAVSSVVEGRSLIYRLAPPSGRLSMSARLSAYFYDFFTTSSYGTRLS